jgi:hypothetical protein
MNVNIESSQMRNVELKYCERCGNIWLRRTGSKRTQCVPCAKAETALLNGSFLQIWSRLRSGELA